MTQLVLRILKNKMNTNQEQALADGATVEEILIWKSVAKKIKMKYELIHNKHGWWHTLSSHKSKKWGVVAKWRQGTTPNNCCEIWGWAGDTKEIFGGVECEDYSNILKLIGDRS